MKSEPGESGNSTGRPPSAANWSTAALEEAALESLDESDGKEHLLRPARKHPGVVREAATGHPPTTFDPG